MLTQKCSPVHSNAKNPSNVDTTARKHVGNCVQKNVTFPVRKLSLVDMKKPCLVLMIPWMIKGVTTSVPNFSSVAILVQEHANNAVNVTPKLKLNYRVVIENKFYVERKTRHHSARRDAGEH